MINREITYERNIQKSYMKIPAVLEETLDEKIMLKRPIEGLLFVEKSFVNQKGQYWYNISGKQALDVYCRMNTIGRDFFEGLLLRICNQLDILEWNLLDTNCLVVDPELIFVDSLGEEVSFTLYPQKGRDFFQEFRELMEYLLPQIDHEDREAVASAYQIYQMSLLEGCSIGAIRDCILNNRKVPMAEIEEENMQQEDSNIEHPLLVETEQKSLFCQGDRWKHMEEKMGALFEKAKEILKSRPEDLLRKKEKEEVIPSVVYPEEEPEPACAIQLHPTVCIAAVGRDPQGLLVYEGRENYPDFSLEKNSCIIGKSPKVKCRINRETISQFHAKIDFFQETYYIEDMNSTNGTYLNEELLNFREKRVLQIGDVLCFGDVKYRFL